MLAWSGPEGRCLYRVALHMRLVTNSLMGPRAQSGLHSGPISHGGTEWTRLLEPWTDWTHLHFTSLAWPDAGWRRVTAAARSISLSTRGRVSYSFQSNESLPQKKQKAPKLETRIRRQRLLTYVFREPWPPMAVTFLSACSSCMLCLITSSMLHQFGGYQAQ